MYTFFFETIYARFVLNESTYTPNPIYHLPTLRTLFINSVPLTEHCSHDSNRSREQHTPVMNSMHLLTNSNGSTR